MGKFNTHGGYFAPKDYFRINEGGSHSENPNGGVQIGVDQNGVPNLLEEGEPVFKDFVFSDNIKANKSILKEMLIPEKYEGMLYSEIADKFIEEAESRPMDPISNNGLRAMLSRLADAQEEQKLRKEEAELKSELKKLSPEELMMLGASMNQQNQEVPTQQPQTVQTVSPQQMVPEQQIPVEQQTAVMALGGLIPDKPKTGYADFISNYGLSVQEADDYINSLSEEDREYLLSHGYPRPKEGLGVAGMLAGAGTLATKGAKAVKTTASNLLSKVPSSFGDKLAKGAKTTGKVVKNLILLGVDPTYLWRTLPKAKTTVGNIAQIAGKVAQSGLAVSNIVNTVSGGRINPVSIAQGIADSNYRQATEADDIPSFEYYKKGGRLVKKFDEGSPNFNYGFMALPDSKYSKASLPEYSLVVDADKPYGKSQGRSQNRIKLMQVPKIKDEPVYGLDGVFIDDEPILTDEDFGIDLTYTPEEFSEEIQAITPKDLNLSTPYPTNSRYAGVLGNLFATMNNIAQKPDNYQYSPITVSMPTVDIPLQMQDYTPMDMSLPARQIIAQGNATSRAIGNSGAGPATDALLLANGFNTANAIGNAAMQGSLANAQQRNAVVKANNASIAQRASMLQQAAERRAALQSQIDQINRRNALQAQMLNNQSQQTKASAIGTTLENLASGLAGIGTENFRLNTMRGLPYTMDSSGNITYHSGACGGSLRKYGK